MFVAVITIPREERPEERHPRPLGHGGVTAM